MKKETNSEQMKEAMPGPLVNEINLQSVDAVIKCVCSIGMALWTMYELY